MCMHVCVNVCCMCVYVLVGGMYMYVCVCVYMCCLHSEMTWCVCMCWGGMYICVCVCVYVTVK